ncbi:MAG TPA: diaminopimelate epimerase [Candidatus Limnocylindrales bacterium]|nr:diaminopimelate epimerase [Candidatus Limnocylindrales bacterium]
MRVKFTKAHGARNDFLLTWSSDAPEADMAALARAICDRHTGVGADGWMIVTPPVDAEAEGSIRLYNSDGSVAEISGNGTRCAAAFLIRHGYAPGVVRIRTGAGIKTLRTLHRKDLEFEFEMNMGRPRVIAERFELPLSTGPRDVVLMDVGNPQCAIPVQDFEFDWRAVGAEVEAHRHFPNRTNVSFIRPVDRHTIEARFYERGAGETMSSGTGSTGAAVAAVVRKMAESPVKVLTPAGPLELIWKEQDVFLTGPAVIVAEGDFLL